MTTLREAAQQMLNAVEDSGHKSDLMAAADALRAALAEQKCPCGDRPADQCPGEWEPGCDLGANEKHAKVVKQAQPVACHVLNVTVSGSLHEWEPTTLAFSLKDGKHALYTTPPAPVAPPGWRMVPVVTLERWQAAFAEELAAWDIDPPLHHVKTSHDEIAATLAAAPEAPTLPAPQPLTEPLITNGMVIAAREAIARRGEVVPRTHTMAEALHAALLASPAQSTTPAPQPLTELPPLPESEYWLAFYDEGGMQEASGKGYAADQMRAYARAVEAEVLRRMGVQR